MVAVGSDAPVDGAEPAALSADDPGSQPARVAVGEAGECPVLLEFLEARPVGLELFAPHRAFPGAARQAAGQHVEFVVAGQELDVDIIPDLLPVLGVEAEVVVERIGLRAAVEPGAVQPPP